MLRGAGCVSNKKAHEGKGSMGGEAGCSECYKHNYIVEPILLVKLQGHYFHNGPVRFPEKLTGPLNF